MYAFNKKPTKDRTARVKPSPSGSIAVGQKLIKYCFGASLSLVDFRLYFPIGDTSAPPRIVVIGR